MAEDVVVEFFLPEFAAMLLAIIVGRLLFEILNEVQQVSRLVQSAGEDVEVVRHGAVGLDGEIMMDRLCVEFLDNVGGSFGIGEGGMTLRATLSDEVAALAQVVSGREPDVFVVAMHATQNEGTTGGSGAAIILLG